MNVLIFYLEESVHTHMESLHSTLGRYMEKMKNEGEEGLTDKILSCTTYISLRTT